MSESRRLLVHVGAPKTGTSFVQDVLWQNRERLAAQGVLYPAERFDEHFLAALDLMELPWGGLEKQAVGAWDRLAERVRAWPGTVIVSHEILATASKQQVHRAFDSFGEGREVHVVLSARDLVRQIPAEWQENVKHRRTVSYRGFLDRVTDPSRGSELASWFWGVQEVPDVLDRWGSTLPPDQVHLVTVPRAGAPRDLLWQRFASVLGLDPDALAPETTRANPSMGVPETALVRRINSRVNRGVLANEDYRQFVRELLAHRTLSQRSGSPRLALPADVRAWAVELSEAWIKELAGRGYDVVGSLDELRPDAEADTGYADPDTPDEDAVADAAMASIVTLLEEAARLQHEERLMRRERDAAHAELERSRGLWFRAKRKLVRTADTHRAAALALGAYRRIRGSSSRSA
ncbi:MAG: hypothetical protein HOQ45_10055 [Nocardioidaceae bacterium]|nr:hypothetical protein [Nocardioidaceae bacterium]